MSWRRGKLPAAITLLVVIAAASAILLDRKSVPPESGEQITATGDWKDVSTEQIRVSTYNIDGADNASITEIAAVIAADDVVGIQEAQADGVFGRPNQVRQLGEVNGQGWLFAPAQGRLLADYSGNGLLSRFEVTAWSRWPLEPERGSPVQSKRHRGLLVADIQVAGQPVKLLVTHLDRTDARYFQAEAVFTEFAKYPRAILLGDLNSRPIDERFMKLLAESGGRDVIGEILGDRDPAYRVDWIITRGLDTVDGDLIFSDVSDHPYCWALLTPSP